MYNDRIEKLPRKDLRTNVELVEPKTIPISEGKIKRIVDLRSH